MTPVGRRKRSRAVRDTLRNVQRFIKGGGHEAPDALSQLVDKLMPHTTSHSHCGAAYKAYKVVI